MEGLDDLATHPVDIKYRPNKGASLVNRFDIDEMSRVEDVGLAGSF
ncbi:hypothetical protein [uncultured Roseibium sp.]|nr:hypothetical protein [uncultured Roseibium sp.]